MWVFCLQAEPEGRLLDGFAIVGECGVELPEAVQTVSLMGQNYTDVEQEDLHHFVSLKVIS
jgi:hypothetical protein